MSEPLLDRDAIILHEMMAHVPLFTHQKPQTIAVINDCNQGIVQEVLKHPTVKQVWQNNTPTTEPDALDAVIIADRPQDIDIDYYFSRLLSEGILIQLSESPFQLSELKKTQQHLKAVGFADILPLQFPQPSFKSGWRSAIIAIKEGTIRRPREKDIFNKSFATHYYNLDVHRAAFALPEFMRLELEV